MNRTIKPNILFLFPDQHRGDWLPYEQEILKDLDFNELPLKMPNLKRLMENGTTFTNCITPSPLCAPARACLAAGLRYKNCQVEDNSTNYPTQVKTFYTALREVGYQVGGVGKFDLHKGSSWWGLDGFLDFHKLIGFTKAIDNEGKWDGIGTGYKSPKGPYLKYLHDKGLVEVHKQDMDPRKLDKDILNTSTTPLPDEAYCDNWLSQNGLDLLKTFPEDEPWFLQVNFTGPHDPWDVTESMMTDLKNTQFPPAIHCDAFPLEKVNSVRQNYCAMLENIDRNIGRFMEVIKLRGELDHTLIVYSSDHGEMLGDFNKFGKSTPEKASIHIPLIVSGPGVQKNITSHALVELQDLAATFIDYADTQMDEAKESISLRSILEGYKTTHRHYITSALIGGKGKGRAKVSWETITNEDYKLICLEGKPARLYNLIQDPWETTNIIESEESISLNLYKQLVNW